MEELQGGSFGMLWRHLRLKNGGSSWICYSAFSHNSQTAAKVVAGWLCIIGCGRELHHRLRLDPFHVR